MPLYRSSQDDQFCVDDSKGYSYVEEILFSFFNFQIVCSYLIQNYMIIFFYLFFSYFTMVDRVTSQNIKNAVKPKKILSGDNHRLCSYTDLNGIQEVNNFEPIIIIICNEKNYIFVF